MDISDLVNVENKGLMKDEEIEESICYKKENTFWYSLNVKSDGNLLIITRENWCPKDPSDKAVKEICEGLECQNRSSMVEIFDVSVNYELAYEDILRTFKHFEYDCRRLDLSSHKITKYDLARRCDKISTIERYSPPFEYGKDLILKVRIRRIEQGKECKLF